MKVPLPTVIHVEHLPPASRRRLRGIAAHQAAIAPTVAAPLPRAAPLALAGLAVVVAAAAAPALQRLDPGRLGALAALAVVLAAAAAVARAVGRLRLAARLPLPPGRYVIGAYVVDATTPLVTVVPIARTRPTVERRWGRAALRFDSEVGACRVAVPAAHLERVLAWMHGDVVAYAAALAAGDRATAGQLDPLAEARDPDGTVIGVPGPARGRLGLALARWR
ncbi:MAG: hypothetical protein JNK64_36515 [Myxococcales bacterium]|nr:hypothetical protein [Myxococcales bacterium]